MDRGVKIIMAACILVGGASVAMLFRHPPSRAGPIPPGAYEPLLLRAMSGAQSAAQADQGRSTGEPSSEPAPRPRTISRHSATILTPTDAIEPPPLSRSYPSSRPPATSRWGTSMVFGLSGRAETDEPPPLGTTGHRAEHGRVAAWSRTHKIVDGDTLPALAERYLGSADCYMEIFEANRYALPSPDVLPIGVELKIPPRRGPAPSSAHFPPEERLVPIPSGSQPTKPTAEADRSNAAGDLTASSRQTAAVPGAGQ